MGADSPREARLTKSPEWKKYWDSKRQQLDNIAATGCCIVSLRPSPRGGAIHVHGPFQVEFMNGARELGGRWKRRSKVWVFRPPSILLVIELCKRVYGEKKVILKGFREERE